MKSYEKSSMDQKKWIYRGKGLDGCQVTVREFTEEDCVLDSRDRKLRIEGIRSEELSEPVKAYNFETEEYHEYYVGGIRQSR